MLLKKVNFNLTLTTVLSKKPESGEQVCHPPICDVALIYSSKENELENMLSDSDSIHADSVFNGAFSS